jgi:hypothetical protein
LDCGSGDRGRWRDDDNADGRVSLGRRGLLLLLVVLLLLLGEGLAVDGFQRSEMET